MEALLDEGYLVTPASTLSGALLAMERAGDGQLPDAVVLDTQDGHDLVAKVRSSERYANVALVTLSFSFDPPSHADVDVRRPFRLDDLLEAVREALRLHGVPYGQVPLHPGA